VGENFSFFPLSCQSTPQWEPPQRRRRVELSTPPFLPGGGPCLGYYCHCKGDPRSGGERGAKRPHQGGKPHREVFFLFSLVTAMSPRIGRRAASGIQVRSTPGSFPAGLASREQHLPAQPGRPTPRAISAGTAEISGNAFRLFGIADNVGAPRPGPAQVLITPGAWPVYDLIQFGDSLPLAMVNRHLATFNDTRTARARRHFLRVRNGPSPSRKRC